MYYHKVVFIDMISSVKYLIMLYDITLILPTHLYKDKSYINTSS